MSGGRFNHTDSSLKRDIFGWVDKPHNVFEDLEISEMVWDMLELIHMFDWYISGDTSKEKYLEVKYAFKKKWFDNHNTRVREIIDDALAQTKHELYETFNVKEKDEETI